MIKQETPTSALQHMTDTPRLQELMEAWSLKIDKEKGGPSGFFAAALALAKQPGQPKPEDFPTADRVTLMDEAKKLAQQHADIMADPLFATADPTSNVAKVREAKNALRVLENAMRPEEQQEDLSPGALYTRMQEPIRRNAAIAATTPLLGALASTVIGDQLQTPPSHPEYTMTAQTTTPKGAKLSVMQNLQLDQATTRTRQEQPQLGVDGTKLNEDLETKADAMFRSVQEQAQNQAKKKPQKTKVSFAHNKAAAGMGTKVAIGAGALGGAVLLGIV